MPKKEKVKSAGDINNLSILGTFEGECADSNITNKNGLDITREVWETVFNSEEYKEGIELGHYIGFLGHPEDPNCMDFEHGCIVMTEGYIDDNGKIYGKFNLIDTPVGRIAKSFIDAGVKFGISVRGAGEIIDDSVEPESFVFRGFDLVSFPAYPESIPEFKEIAASTDINKQKKYKAMCKAVKANIDALTTDDAIDIIQPYFPEDTDEFKMLEEKRSQVEEDVAEEVLDEAVDEAVKYKEQIAGLIELYKQARTEIAELQSKLANTECLASEAVVTANRKLKSIKNKFNDQLDNMEDVITSSKHKVKKAIKASKSYKKKYESTMVSLNNLRQENLKYKQRIRSAEDTISQKDKIISSLQVDLDETVANSKEYEKKASNLGVKVDQLTSDIKASERLIQEYQDAYGNMYADALGVHLDDVTISASTSVDELRTIISKSSISASTDVNASPDVDTLYVEDDNSSDIVSL